MLERIAALFGGAEKDISRQSSLGKIDPRGPVFISYRQSDGSHIAAETAWAFRAAGVPVWHDESDLPPGDTDRRLLEALGSGLSGAVLLVTPEIRCSRVVREVELPKLLELEKDSAFTFSVLSIISDADGKLDYDAPDRLLGQSAGTLLRFKQESAHTGRQRADAARAHCQRRMQSINESVVATDRSIKIDVQTRIPPFATRVDEDLVLRLRPPEEGNRRPNRRALGDLKRFLSDLPQLLALSGAEQARVKGGAHLSVAYAIGAAMPTTLFGRVEVIDTYRNVWVLNETPGPTGDANYIVNVVSNLSCDLHQGPILVYLDLTPTRSDDTFEGFVAENSDRFAASFHIRAKVHGTLSHLDAGDIVHQASMIIRQLAGESRTSEVHLLLKCPWTVASLLGRTLNTLRVQLYEWEDDPNGDSQTAKPKYLPSLVVRSGAGGGPIESVDKIDS